MIRVLVAANSAVLRAGLEAVVRSGDGLEFIGASSLGDLDGRTAAADVLLVELPQLDEDWIGVVAEFSIPAVVLAEIEDPVLIASVVRSGIRSVLSADANQVEIATAIQAIAAGLVALQRATLELLVGDSRPAPAQLDEPLTPRELEVLNLIAEGSSNKLIAHRLGISEHTVKFHVASIMGKLSAGSRTDAVMQGIRRGLVLL